MKKKCNLTLNEIHDLIQKNLALIPQDQIEHFQKIQQRITAIEHILKGWLAGGSLSSYSKLKEFEQKKGVELQDREINLMKKAQSQEELTQEYHQAYIKMHQFVKIQVEQLRKDLCELKKEFEKKHNVRKHFYSNEPRVLSKRHQFLFDEIQQCLNAVAGQLHLNDEEHQFASISNDQIPLKKLVLQLGGKYLPINQSLDPLIGKYRKKGKIKKPKGMCYGHTKRWAEQLMDNTGNHSFLTISDKKTIYQQENQLNFRINEKVIAKYANYGSDFHAITIAKMLSAIHPGNIYKLGIKNHAMGLCQFHSGEIEFFDSNSVVIVFPNLESFRVWFSIYYVACYFKENELFSIAKIGTISTQQHSSIPLEDSSNQKKIAEKAYLFKQIIEDLHTLEETPPLRKWIESIFINANFDSLQSQEMDEQFIKLYQTIGIHRAYLDEIRAASQQRKKQVINLIEKEINRLKNCRDSHKNLKMTALSHLTSAIEQAHFSVSLKSVVATWMLTKQDNKPSNAAVLTINHDQHFIINLLQHHEISIIHLDFSQEKINRLIKQMLVLNWNQFLINGKQEKKSALIREINLIVAQDLAPSIILERIILASKKHYSHHRLWRWWNRRSEQENYFCKILSTIDLNNPSSLEQSYSSLESLMKKSFSEDTINQAKKELSQRA